MKRRSEAGGTSGRTTTIAWGLAGLSFLLVAAGAFFLISTRDVRVVLDWGFRGYPAVLALPLATVGAILAWKRPQNPIGWLFCFAGLNSAVQVLVEEYGV